MPIPLVAVGCICMVKTGAVMGNYSLKNYDPNPGSAYDRKERTLPGTDGRPVEAPKKKRYDEDGKPVK